MKNHLKNNSFYKRVSELKKVKNIPSSLLNFGIILVCLSGLLYQSYDLVNQYISGETVVSLKLERLETKPLPAFTICLPKFLSLKKASEFDSVNNKLYMNYTRLLEEYWNNDTTLNNTIPKDKDLNSKLAGLYLQIRNRIIKANLSAIDVLANFSVPDEG